MDRKTFIKLSGMFGMCCCVAHPTLANNTSKEKSEDAKKIKELTGKIDFIQKRFGKLIEIMDSNVNDKKRRKILVSLGQECAKEYEKNLVKYKNNLKGFIDFLKKMWMERVEYNEEKKTILLIGKKYGKCFCPFVKKSVTPPDFCECSLGWQKRIFETIIGKPIKSKIIESILRGGERCSFFIRIT